MGRSEEPFPYLECHSEAKPKNLLFLHSKSRCVTDAQQDMCVGIQRDRVFITSGRAEAHESLRGEMNSSLVTVSGRFMLRAIARLEVCHG